MEEKKALLLEGLLPVDVWNAVIVILALFGVGIAVFKGIILIRDEVKKHKKEKAVSKKDVTLEQRYTARLTGRQIVEVRPQV